MSEQAEKTPEAGADPPVAEAEAPDGAATAPDAAEPEAKARARAAAAAKEKAAAEQMDARFRERLAELQQQAEAGLPEAMHIVGIAHARGRGVPQDYGKAVEYFKRAAALGHLGARVSLGYCYATGRGVPRDLACAYVLLREAADMGSREAFELAQRVAQRLHVEQLRRCDATVRRRRILRRLRREGREKASEAEAPEEVLEIDPEAEAGEP